MIFYKSNNTLSCKSALNHPNITKLEVILDAGQLEVIAGDSTLLVSDIYNCRTVYAEPETTSPNREIRQSLTENKLWQLCKMISDYYRDPLDILRKSEAEKRVSIFLAPAPGKVSPRAICTLTTSVADVYTLQAHAESLREIYTPSTTTKEKFLTVVKEAVDADTLGVNSENSLAPYLMIPFLEYEETATGIDAYYMALIRAFVVC